MLNFKDLYNSYASEVYRFAFWLAGNRYEAEDITSETFIRAWGRRSTIRTETLKAYLFTIARNFYLEERRKKKRRIALHDIYRSPAPEPDRLFESRIELIKVRYMLQTLPEIDRTAFMMRVEHELPYDEIARILELSLSAAKVKVHRVRKKLIAACIELEDY